MKRPAVLKHTPLMIALASGMAVFTAAGTLAIIASNGSALYVVSWAAMALINTGTACKLHSLRRRSHGDHRGADQGIHSDSDTPTITLNSGAELTVTIKAIAPVAATPAVRPRERRTVERAGIVLGEIDALRCWEIAGNYLTSINGVIWIPGQPMREAEVTITNGAGVHAFKTMEKLLENYGKHSPIAIGRVHLWGRIVEHEDGYRAEFAVPVEILKVQGSGDLAAIRANYGLG